MGKFKDYFNRLRGHPKNSTTYTLRDTTLAELLGGTSANDPLSVSTYLTCLKILSETMGKIPIKVLQDENGKKKRLNGHSLYQSLNYSPNPLYNAVVMRQMAEFQRNHFGNAYIWKDYKTGYEWLLNPESITPMVTADNRGLIYIYKEGSLELKILPEELIHLKSHITDSTGIKGIPIRTYLETNLSGQAASDSFIKTLAESGMTGQKLFMTIGQGGQDINAEVAKNMIEKIESFSKIKSGKLIPLPPFVDVKSMDLKLTDSQFFELRKLSSEQISSAFGIPSMMLNDLTKSSYSSQEMQTISFLVNTLQPIIQQYEVEVYIKRLTREEKKNGVYVSYNTNSLLRTTAKEQVEYLTACVSGTLMSVNEARGKMELDDSDNPMANELIVGNGAAIPLKLLGKQYDSITGGGA